MFQHWDKLKARFEQLGQILANASVLDQRRRQELAREYSCLQSLLAHYEQLCELERIIAQTQTQREQVTDADLRLLYDDELEQLKTQYAKKHAELDDLMFPPDERNDCSAYVEVRAGTGGQEAALFAADLARMYTNYALSRGWSVSLVDASQTDLKGYREVVLSIEGNGVYGALKFESGTHRVQRVPLTEASGRVHTSTATVAVFPDVQVQGEVSFDPGDLRIDVFRAGGAGGQHVNKTESAVRITHIPTGVVVSCQDDRSQHKNKAKALKILQARLLAAAHEKKESERSHERKQMIGRGMRAEKVRTYNFPQNRVTDHQIEITLKNLDMVIEGNLEPLISALQERERQERCQDPLPFMSSLL